jgi:hypothetical protein
MAKEFYTERDIEDMFKRGQTALELSDDVVLTELAYEKAQRLGMKLIARHDTPPAAPIRPYISMPVTAPQQPIPTPQPQPDDLRKRVQAAATAKLGTQVDPALLDAILSRVIEALGKN